MMMTNIELGEENKEQVIKEAINHLKPIMEKLRAHEDEIGEQLSIRIKQARIKELTLSVLCPKCGRKLHVVKSRKSGKRFVGCLGKWEGACSFTLPLPGIVTDTDWGPSPYWLTAATVNEC
jgi:hypothetical protein